MKKFFFGIIAGLAITTMVAFKATNNEVKNNIDQTSNEIKKDYANVNRISGLFIFLESNPLSDYEVLGTVKKTGLVWSGKPKEMQNILIRRALKDYPNCDGIIIDDISMDHATVIKFK
jgi:predicted small secreted protein